MLPEGAGDGDFDAALSLGAAPDGTGLTPGSTRLLLGGIAELSIGSQAGEAIMLPGASVAPRHGRLVRVDFGPSRWKVVDDASPSGVYVNGERIAEQELADGDHIQIGDYEFWYRVDMELEQIVAAAAPASGGGLTGSAPGTPAAALLAPVARTPIDTHSNRAEEQAVAKRGEGGGQVCPSCNQTLPRSAKICVACGINVKTGRPVLTSSAADEDELYVRAETWIKIVSLLVWVTPLPIPIRSEAFGTRKPYAIWTIAAATILASLTFFFANWSAARDGGTGINLMLWAPSHESTQAREDVPSEDQVRQAVRQMDRQKRREFDPSEKLSDEELSRMLEALLKLGGGEPRGEFHVYQLLTHAFLHDTSSIYNFIMHLAGNMLFLMVFGTRVNALIGNLATAILYPILAAAAALIYLWSIGDSASGPMLGASGAIMGLAGVYLILFPVHKVVCAMWIRIWGLSFGFYHYFGCKIFEIRGFWLLLVYFGYDIVMNWLSKKMGSGGGGVAHWAHIGGFATGAVIGIAILVSRRFNTRGGDLLSVTLGKNAWPLIGKPSQWALR